MGVLFFSGCECLLQLIKGPVAVIVFVATVEHDKDFILGHCAAQRRRGCVVQVIAVHTSLFVIALCKHAERVGQIEVSSDSQLLPAALQLFFNSAHVGQTLGELLGLRETFDCLRGMREQQFLLHCLLKLHLLFSLVFVKRLLEHHGLQGVLVIGVWVVQDVPTHLIGSGGLTHFDLLLLTVAND